MLNIAITKPKVAETITKINKLGTIVKNQGMPARSKYIRSDLIEFFLPTVSFLANLATMRLPIIAPPDSAAIVKLYPYDPALSIFLTNSGSITDIPLAKILNIEQDNIIFKISDCFPIYLIPSKISSNMDFNDNALSIADILTFRVASKIMAKKKEIELTKRHPLTPIKGSNIAPNTGPDTLTTSEIPLMTAFTLSIFTSLVTMSGKMALKAGEKKIALN